jgi:hypothetical protein
MKKEKTYFYILKMGEAEEIQRLKVTFVGNPNYHSPTDEPLELMWKNNRTNLPKISELSREEKKTLISILTDIPQLIRYPHRLENLLRKNPRERDLELRKIKAEIPLPPTKDQVKTLINQTLTKITATGNKLPGVDALSQKNYEFQLTEFIRRSVTGVPCPIFTTSYVDTLSIKIKCRYFAALARPGYMAGNFSGDATASQTIQNSLNAFHTPGALRRSTGDTFLAMISTKDPTEHVSDAFFRERLSEKKAFEITREMIGVKMSDIILQSRIIDVKMNDVFPENKIITRRISDWYSLIPQKHDVLGLFQNSQYFIYLKLDVLKVKESRLLLTQISNVLEESMKDQNIKVLFSPLYLGELYIIPPPQSSLPRLPEGSTAPILRNSDHQYYIFSFLNSVMKNIFPILVKGLPDIDKINVESYQIINSFKEEGFSHYTPGCPKIPIYYATINIEELKTKGVGIENLVERLSVFYNKEITIESGYRKDRLLFSSVGECKQLGIKVEGNLPKEYLNRCQEKIKEKLETEEIQDLNNRLNVTYVKVAGKGVSSLMCHPLIDPSATLEETDVKMMCEIIGIEGVRNMLIYRMKESLGSLKVNPRHLSLIADFMTFRGTLVPISFRGASKMGLGPSAMATFEQVANSFGTAAFTAATEDTESNPTLGSIFGGRPLIGKRYALAIAPQTSQLVGRESDIYPILEPASTPVPVLADFQNGSESESSDDEKFVIDNIQ